MGDFEDNEPQLCSGNVSHTQSDRPGSILGRGSPINQAVRPSVVGNLAAISRQLGDHCRMLLMLKRVGGKMAGVRTTLPLAQPIMRWFSAVHTGDLRINV